MAKVLKKYKIGILGPGAIGSLLGALLCRAGNQVHCFGSRHAVDSIQRDGIQIKSGVFGDFQSRLSASVGGSSPVDILFITVKAPALRVALNSITGCIGNHTIIVSLLNGIGHRELIRHKFGYKVIVGTIGAVEVSMYNDRIVLHRSSMVPSIEIASDKDFSSDILSNIVSLLKNAGLSAAIGANENEVIWRKLARLSAIATMTSYTHLPIGKIRANAKTLNDLQALVYELCQIACAQGFNVSPVDVMHQVDALPEELTTSMERDIRAGKPSEIESIIGEPLRLGQSMGLSLPTIEQYYLYLKSQTGC